MADQLLETVELVTLGLTDHCQPQPISMITSKMLMLDWHGIVLIANTESSSSCFLNACSYGTNWLKCQYYVPFLKSVI